VQAHTLDLPHLGPRHYLEIVIDLEPIKVWVFLLEISIFVRWNADANRRLLVHLTSRCRGA